MDLLNSRSWQFSSHKYLNGCCHVYFRVKMYKYDIKGCLEFVICFHVAFTYVYTHGIAPLEKFRY